MRTAGRSLAAFRRGALVRQDGGRIQHDPGGVSHRGAGQRVLESREWRVVLRRASPHDLSGDFGCVPPASILDCEQDWNVWHPEYDKKLGPPTANATVDGAKYHRSFGKSRDYCWHLGCILPKSASNNRANRTGRWKRWRRTTPSTTSTTTAT